uniref:alpha-N-acetylgalactosaminide alpha-2,6-sialyltransferase n=1 Tax=Myripristis murdjan TaxID=586833 RepID=A0A668AJ34_9TELE
DVSVFWGKIDSVTSPSPSVSNAMTTDLTTQPTTERPLRQTVMPMLFRKDFKKMPRWDFDDVYIQDAQPTCAQSLRKSEDESFTKAFIPNIRLFMYKGDINISEWNRLSHFNNPFGFMQANYSEMKPILDLIPKAQEPLLPPKTEGDGCVRCAVVGTAGILYGSGKGKEIDAHDYVFRMNGAVITGFEDDVGDRTSVYVHTAHSITTGSSINKKHIQIGNTKGDKH